MSGTDIMQGLSCVSNDGNLVSPELAEDVSVGTTAGGDPTSRASVSAQGPRMYGKPKSGLRVTPARRSAAVDQVTLHVEDTLHVIGCTHGRSEGDQEPSDKTKVAATAR